MNSTRHSIISRSCQPTMQNVLSAAQRVKENNFDSKQQVVFPPKALMGISSEDGARKS